MTVYYASDMHFGSETMTKYDIYDAIEYNRACNTGLPRLFANGAERDSFIIESWNNKVGNHDTVYILGDAFNCNEQKARKILKRLNGNKRLIIGNHDKKWLRDIAESGKYRFSGTPNNYEKIKDNGRTVVLCHYPIAFWDEQHAGAYHVYGHLHGTLEEKLMESIAEIVTENGSLPEYRAFNAGIMLHDYAPTSLDELIDAHSVNPILSKNDFMNDTRPWIVNGEDKLNKIIRSATQRKQIAFYSETYTTDNAWSG